MATQVEIAQGLVDQLRLIDPGVGAQVGSIERSILDVVSAALADAQVDLNVLSGSLNIDAKFGSDLDNFLSLFNFGRQPAVAATGFVTFSRTTTSTSDIRIPANTQVQAPNLTSADNDSISVYTATYSTTQDVILKAGSLSVVAPVQATVTGTLSNAPVSAITDFLGLPPTGITSVTNITPVTQGLDAETDNELKVRFRNTVFRNVSGTTDQYLALAASTPSTTRANVIGPVSRYREYIQVPFVDDATAIDVNGDGVTESGGGNIGEYTTALSTIPYSKHTYLGLPIFLSNGLSGVDAVFYRQDTDFTFNTTDAARDIGDARRFHNASIPIGVVPSTVPYQPNITVKNVYTGVDSTLTGIRPGDVVLLEYAYLSSVSRNDVDRNITNCVDVFVDGENRQNGDVFLLKPSPAQAFVNNPTSPYYVNNYRRVGEPEHRPLIGNILQQLFFQPNVDLPDSITATQSTTTYTYYKGIHYWPVEDVSSIGGTVRSRSGVEWSANIAGKLDADPEGGPYTGLVVTSLSTNTGVLIENYTFDQNIIDLQSSLEANKQVTTDVLAHRAHTRYFKLDITVMYSPGYGIAQTNLQIQNNVKSLLGTQFFGSAIQLSDLIQAVHNVGGVDNVRWTTDVAGVTAQARMYETDVYGAPLLNGHVDRIIAGHSSPNISEIQQLILTGSPSGGTFKLSWNGYTTSAIPYNAASGTIASALNAVPISANVTVTGTGTPADPFIITFTSPGARNLITIDGTSLTGGPTIIAGDFFLQDNELATLAPTTYTPPTGLADTVPGLIIRARAQSSWNAR